jgi:hypothetical protein
MSSNARITNLDFTAPPVVARWQRRALAVGAVFTLATIAGFVVDTTHALHAYLIAYMLCLGLTLGSMAWVMVWHLTGGDWGVMVRRLFEAAIGTLPLMMVGFIPILIGVHKNYVWSQPAEIAHSEHLMRLAGQYLNFKLFLFRGIVYFVCWGLLAFYLLRWSRLQDSPPDRAFGAVYRAISAAGLVVYAWTLTFATIDWVMSLTPDWSSSIYGLIFMVGQGLLSMCLIVILAHLLRSCAPMSEVLEPRNFHDYGKLMLTFVMLWAYFNFSQWLIIWAGNLPEEIRWYLDRIHGDWGYVALALVVGHFAIPFCILLSRPFKQNSAKLVWLAVWLVLMRYLDLYWNIEPNFSREHFHYTWVDAVVPIGMLGLWLAYFFWNLRKRPLVVLHDPHLRAVLGKQHE